MNQKISNTINKDHEESLETSRDFFCRKQFLFGQQLFAELFARSEQEQKLS